MLRNIFKTIFIVVFCLFTSLVAQAQTINSLLRHPGDPAIGNPNGSITVVEFFDYQCFHCRKMVPVIYNIVKNNPNVRFVFKDYPVRSSASELASRAAVAANQQNKYIHLYTALLQSRQSLSEQMIYRTAEKVGLDVNKLKADMDDAKVSKQLNSNIGLGIALHIPGTPVFYIAKTDAQDSSQINYVIGEMSERAMQEAIDQVARG